MKTHNARVPIVLSWSGGKDSSLALRALRQDPAYEVVALLTSITCGYDRVSIHGVRRELIEAQARSVGLDLMEIFLEPQSSNDQYERAFREGLERAARKFPGVRHIAFGDLFLADVRAYRERLAAESTWEPVFPIWGRSTRALADEFIAAGFVAHLVCVDTHAMPASFAGRAYDADLLHDLPATADPCGERGEFHTFVSAGPVLGEPLRVRVGEVVLREDRFAYCDLLSEADEAACATRSSQ